MGSLGFIRRRGLTTSAKVNVSRPFIARVAGDERGLQTDPDVWHRAVPVQAARGSTLRRARPIHELVAYLWMYRAGDLALVSQVLGHADHEDFGIMHLLFREALTAEGQIAPGVAVYNRWDSGTPGLRQPSRGSGSSGRTWNGSRSPRRQARSDRAEARVYPAHLLREGGTGLCLFAARFWGVNDAIHMARQQMDIQLVDTSPRVLEMADIYANNCSGLVTDAWDFAEDARDAGILYDAVSCDTFTGDPMTRSLASLELWCSLARDVVTVTHTPGAPYDVPDGWNGELFPRNERVNWLVLTPC